MKITNEVKEVKTIAGSIKLELTPREFFFLLALAGDVAGYGEFREVMSRIFDGSRPLFKNGIPVRIDRSNDLDPPDANTKTYVDAVETYLENFKV